MTYEIDVTPANDPLGTILTTLGDDDLLAGTRFRPVKLGSGMVQVVIDADSPKAGALEDEVFLRIRDTVIGDYIYSGSLSNAQVKLISEKKDRRVLTWSGLGALGPLARMTLGEDIYALGPPVQTARGSYDVPGMWTWTNVTYGAVGRRQFEEGRDHPDNPFAGMTCTFDREFQTGGTPWTLQPELHQEQVGTNVLDGYVNLIKAGVVFELTPGLVLNGWETFGSDHSGPAFAADVVRFMVGADALDSAANILTDAERAWSSSRVSELIVVGAGNVTVKVNDPTAPFGKVGVYHYPQSSDPAVLTAVGNAELQRRLLRTIGALKLPVILQDDPLNGHYLPGPGRPCWIGNTASAVTGSAAYDFDAAFPTAALDFLLTDAYGWTCEAELGSAFIDSRQRAQDFAVRQLIKSSIPGPHFHPEIYCPPGAIGDENVIVDTVAVAYKASGHDSAAHEDGTAPTLWDSFSAPVGDQWWAVDLGQERTIAQYELNQGPTAAQSATSIRVWMTSDAAKWVALPTNTEAYDFEAAGWILADTLITAPGVNQGTFTQHITGRYLAYDAVAGGASSWTFTPYILNVLEGGSLPMPLAQDGGATQGTCNCAARGCHEHEHGDLSASAGPHHAAVAIKETRYGNVQAAIDTIRTGANGSAGTALSPGSTIIAVKNPANPTFNFPALVENMVKVGSLYWAVYMDANLSGEPSFGLAFTDDRYGLWTEWSGNPIFTEADCTWKAADTDIYAPHLVVDDDQVLLYYSVADDDDGTNGHIGVAVASSINGPYVDSGAAILSPGVGAAWDSRRVAEPCVLHHNNRWHMWYMGESTSVAYQAGEKIGYASADNPIGPWTKDAGNPVLNWSSAGEWDEALVADPSVVFVDGYYVMLYSGGPPTPWILGLAFATDPAGPWTKLPSNPIIDVGGAGTWDQQAAWRGALFVEDGLISGIYAGYTAGFGAGKSGSFELVVEAPGGPHDHDADYEPLGAVATHDGDPDAHEALFDAIASGGLLTVDPGTIAYDDSGPDLVVTIATKWGFDGTDPYFIASGAAAGEEAILAFDPATHDYVVVPYAEVTP